MRLWRIFTLDPALSTHRVSYCIATVCSRSSTVSTRRAPWRHNGDSTRYACSPFPPCSSPSRYGSPCCNSGAAARTETRVECAAYVYVVDDTLTAIRTWWFTWLNPCLCEWLYGSVPVCLCASVPLCLCGSVLVWPCAGVAPSVWFCAHVALCLRGLNCARVTRSVLMKLCGSVPL